MGAISDSILRKPEKHIPPGTPRPVGAQDARSQITATAIIKDKVGKWRFGPEIPIQVQHSAFLEVDLPGGKTIVWTGIEIRVRDHYWSHRELITALWPYSLNWFSNAPFRPPLNRSVRERLDLLHKALESAGPSGLTQALRTLKFDPFTSTHKDDGKEDWRYTARLSDPKRLHLLGTIPLGRGYSISSRSVNYRYSGKANRAAPEWRFGVCEDLGAAVEDLRLEAKSKTDLLDARDRPGGPHSKVADMADHILEGAIWMALAGNRDGSKIGQPVCDEVARIASQLREAADKRANPARPVHVPLGREAAPPEASVLDWDAVIETIRTNGIAAITDWEALEEAPSSVRKTLGRIAQELPQPDRQKLEAWLATTA